MRPTVSWPSSSSSSIASSPSISVASAPARLRDLDEPLRVRARRRADHEDQRRAHRDDLLDGVLAVLRRVADVVGAGPPAGRRSGLPSTSTVAATSSSESVVWRDHGERLAVRLELARLLRGLDDDDLVRPLALRPDHLDVVGVADERDEVAASRRSGAPRRAPSRRAGRRRRRRAGRGARSSRARPARRRAPRARRSRPAGSRPRTSTKTAPSAFEPAHDVVVVDDLVPDVDRRAVLLEQPLDDLDRAVDAGAERPRRREQHRPISAPPPAPCSARRTLPSALERAGADGWRAPSGSRAGAAGRRA